MTHTVHRPRFGTVVALVGRMNVGKSTLFNRILETGRAIVSPTPGTTRDRSYGTTLWQGAPLTFIDTGGLDITQSSDIERNVIKQAERAIDEADILLLVTDAATGVLPQDLLLARRLRAAREKKFVIVANKADNPRLRAAIHGREWQALGHGDLMAVSAANGSGVGDLLDRLAREAPRVGAVLSVPEAATRIAIVGKPNVGKSSLLNALVGEERAIVSPVPGTTRAPEDTLVLARGAPFLLVDTAGLRRRAHVGPGLERQGVERTLRAMERAEVVFFVLDVSEPIGALDRHLGDAIQTAGRALVVVANKWDTVPQKTAATIHECERHLRRIFPHLSYAPIRFVCAKTGERVSGLFEDAVLVKSEWSKTIAAKELDSVMRHAMMRTGHGKTRGRPFLYGLKQESVRPPKFITSQRGAKTSPPPALVHIIERELRAQFGFIGTPLTVEVKPVKRHIPRT